MKLLKNRFSYTAVVLPIIAILLASVYYFYHAYEGYKQSREEGVALAYKNQLSRVLMELGEEQGVVATYIGKGGKSDFHTVESQWDKTDKAIKRLQELGEQNRRYRYKITPILTQLEGLKQERINIQTLNGDLIKNYFDTYIVESVAQIIAGYETDVHLGDHALSRVYQSIVALQANSYTERALVSLFLLRKTPISTEELEVWDRVLAGNDLVDYHHLLSLEQSLKLESILGKHSYERIETKLFSYRTTLIGESMCGRYTIKASLWVDQQSAKIALLERAKKVLLGASQATVEEELTDYSRQMWIAIGVFLFFVILLFIVRSIFEHMESDTKNLEKIIKNIASDSDIESEMALIEMVQQKDKRQMYEFLEHTVLDAKESKRLAEEANSAKSLFLANMSHEIRTPLNGVVGFTDLLKETHLDSEQKEFVQIIKKSSENLLSVINDILDLSKIESEKIEIEHIDFNPIEEFESGIEAYGAKASEKQITFTLYIDPALATHQLKGDPNKIKQVLVNLISNAIKFTPEYGTVDVRIERVGGSTHDRVRFSVKDTGIGVTPEQKSKIFEAFTQADSSTSREFGGTGLGLTISGRLVEFMGGVLDLESQEGEGTRFFFELEMERSMQIQKTNNFGDLHILYYLPSIHTATTEDRNVQTYIDALSSGYEVVSDLALLAEQNSSLHPDLLFVRYALLEEGDFELLEQLDSKVVLLTEVYQKQEVQNQEPQLFRVLYAPFNLTKIESTLLLSQGVGVSEEKQKVIQFKNLRILVAEDNSINQKLIKQTLEGIGAEVSLVDNGKVALDRRMSDGFDIIFMDVQMPVMNGIEATEAILSYEAEYGIPHIPIVALTANALKGDRERFLAEGMDDYMSKPIKIEVLRDLLATYFPDKVDGERVAKQPKSIKIKEPLKAEPTESFNVVLCKYSTHDARIFEVLLHKIGYTVKVAKDFEEMKSLLLAHHVKYALFDKEILEIDRDKEEEFGQLLDRLQVKSIMFVDNMRNATSHDHAHYSIVAPNVPNINLLRTLIIKLNPVEDFEL